MTSELSRSERGASPKANGEYLCFTLGSQCYGIATGNVCHVSRLTRLVPVKQSDSAIKGFFSSYGTSFPVIDLRAEFGFKNLRENPETRIIIVSLPVPSGTEVLLGMIVDSIKSIFRASCSTVAPVPNYEHQVETRYMLGIAEHEGQSVVLLDLPAIFSATTVEEIIAAQRGFYH